MNLHGLSRTAFLLMVFTSGVEFSVAQDTTPTAAELTRQVEIINAQVTLLRAEAARIEAQRALERAQAENAGDLAEVTAQTALLTAEAAKENAERALAAAQAQTAKTLDDVNARKTLTTAEKDLAVAEKDLAIAESQTAAAELFGDVKSAQYTGAVEIKDKGGVAEAFLLASNAVATAAEDIASSIPANVTKLYVIPAAEFPKFQRLASFRFRKELVRHAFESAGVTKPEQPLEGEAPALGLATAGLDALGKLLSFFKSDFTIGGSELTFDNSMVLFAVAGAIQQKGCNAVTVHTPSIYSPTAKTDAIVALSKELLELTQLRDLASQALKLSEVARANDVKQLATAKPEEKAAIQLRIEQATARIDQLKTVAVMHDTFVNSLTAPDAAGTVPALSLAEEIALDAAVNNSTAAIVLVRVEKAGGGYYVKKNLWTGLGAMPLYQMGGAVVSFVVLSGPSGFVLKAGAVPVHGGYMKASAVEKVTKDQRARVVRACGA